MTKTIYKLISASSLENFNALVLEMCEQKWFTSGDVQLDNNGYIYQQFTKTTLIGKLKENDLTVEINTTSYPLEKPVWDLIQNISDERDMYKAKIKSNE